MSNSVLLKKIDELYNEYLSIWEDVCNIESPTSYKKGVDEVGAYFINLANKFGWKVEVFNHNVSGNVVCITMNENAKNAPIALSGHIDTVHPLGLFGKPAVKIKDGNIFGPGVADCKGGIVAGFLAMHALKDCGFINRPIKMLLQTDEETSSRGSNKETINYICEKAKDCLAFFNLEPSGKGTACIERKGILKYSFKITGKEAHASVCAINGANAILEASQKIIELEKVKDNLGVTFNVGVIKGGSVVNTVPGECYFEVDARFLTKNQKEWAENQVKLIAEKNYVKGCTTTLTQMSYRTAMELTDRNVNLLNKVNEILAKNGFETLVAEMRGGGSDAADVTSFGIPCIDSLGVDYSEIHSPNEKSTLFSLNHSAKMLAVIINSL
ncbi:MAG: M20/M25/M40 family metallo-hydrolase [Clostridia bacterium]|nr:M20/M25/M40 family metallo-hydrolase [Clostridia bacterium]